MKCKALTKLWAGIFGRSEEETGPVSRAVQVARLAPLTVGIRVDLSVPTGAGKETAASKFIWVSPAGSSRSVRALRVLLIPN
jgi:hypothetical protein